MCGIVTQQMRRAQTISFAARLLPVLALWAFVLVLVAFWAGSGRMFIRYLAIFPVGWDFAVPFLVNQGGWSMTIISWLPYAGLTTWTMMVRRLSAYLSLYVILCLLFLLNLVGCEELQNANFKQ